MSKTGKSARVDASALAQLPPSEALAHLADAINSQSDATASAGRRLKVADNMLATVKVLQVRIPATAWREIGATGQPAFENSWVNYDTNNNSAAFRIDETGLVRVKGLVKNGTAINTTVFTLPVGYRPPKQIVFPSVAGGGADAFASGRVTAAGLVQGNVGATAYFSLDSVPPFFASAPSAPDAFSATGWPMTVATGLGVPVQGVTAWAVLDSADSYAKSYGAVGVSWARGVGDVISIRRINGLSPERTYTLTLVCWGG